VIVDKDFHYYGTYLAAYAAGFSNDQARVIATSAQYIDDCTEAKTHVTSYLGLHAVEKSYDVNMGEDEIVEWHPMITSVYEMKTWAPTSNYDETRKIWMPFHFLPGNQREQIGVNNAVEIRNATSSQSSMGDWQRDPRFDTFSSKTANSDGLICRPRSEASENMIEFTRANYANYQTMNNTLGLNLLGCVMHVFADTYAHQDFTGVSDKRTNGVRNGIRSNTGRFTNRGTWNAGVWTPNLDTLQNIAWAWDIASQDPLTIHSGPPSTSGALGHGQMGHLNDVSTIYMEFDPKWRKPGLATFSHNNPSEFYRAFEDMVKAMWCVRNNQAFTWSNLPDLPDTCTQDIKNAVMQLLAPDVKEDIDNKLYADRLFVEGKDWFGASEARWQAKLSELCVSRDGENSPFNDIAGWEETAGWHRAMQDVAGTEIAKDDFKALKFVNWNIAAKSLFKENYRFLRYSERGHVRVVRLRALGTAMNLITNVTDDVNRFYGLNDSDTNEAIDNATNTDMVDKILDKPYRINFADEALKYGDIITLKSGSDYLTNCSQTWSKVSYTGRATSNRDEAQALTVYSIDNEGQVETGGKIGKPIKHNDIVLLQTLENTIGSYQFLGSRSSVLSSKVSYYSLYESVSYDPEEDDDSAQNKEYKKFYKEPWDADTAKHFIRNNIRWKVIASNAQDISTSSTVTFQNVSDTSKYLVFKSGKLDLDTTAGNFNLCKYFMKPNA
jgi:hypothetical protein